MHCLEFLKRRKKRKNRGPGEINLRKEKRKRVGFSLKRRKKFERRGLLEPKKKERRGLFFLKGRKEGIGDLFVGEPVIIFSF